MRHIRGGQVLSDRVKTLVRLSLSVAAAVALLVPASSATLAADPAAASSFPRVALLAGPEQIRLSADQRSGQFAVHNPGTAAEAVTVSPAQWITVDAPAFTLAAGETRQVVFTVAVPDHATPGDQPIRIDVAATLDDAAYAAAAAGVTGTPVRSRVVSPVTVVVRVPGTILASVAADTGIPGFLATTTGSVTFTPTIANTGNVAAAWQAVSAADARASVPTLHLSSTLPVLASDATLFGAMDDGAGGTRPSPVTVLPGATLQEQIVLRDAPLLGSYDYTYTLPATGADGLTAVTATGHVLVLNLRKLAFVLLLPMAGLLGLLLAWRLAGARADRSGRRARRGTRAWAPWPLPAGDTETGLLSVRPTTGVPSGHLRGMRAPRRLLPRARTAIVVVETMAMLMMVVGPGPAYVASASEPADPAVTTPAAPVESAPAAPTPADTATTPDPDPAAPDALVRPPAPAAGNPSDVEPAADPTAEPVADPTAAPTAEPATTPDAPAAGGDPAPAPAPAPVVPAASAPAPVASLIVRFKSGTSVADQDAAVAAHGGTVNSAFAAIGVRVISVPAADAAAYTQAYRGDTSVATVEADRVRAVDGAPSDPAYADQWNLSRIGWDTARASVTPTGTSVIAVLDTGISAAHPDLAGRVTGGWSAFGGDPSSDPNGHGTAMAGIAAAATDNGTGIAGTAYAGVSLLSVQVLGADGTGTDSDIIAGIVWAADHGANVILMAFSSPAYSPALQAAVDYAWSRGAVLVAATGNSASTSATYPAGDAHVVGVSATDAADALAPTSNSGSDTFLAAPGVSVPALSVDGGVTSVSGTSASAAQVAGAAAVLRAIDPWASASVIVGRLARSADAAGTASDTGNGRLNLGRAVSDTSTVGVDPSGTGGPFVGPFVPPVYTAAAIAQRGTPTTGTATTTSLSVAMPTGVVAGDVMLIDIMKVGNNTTAPTATGWTLVDGRSLAGGTQRYGAVLYRVATTGETGPYTFALGTGTTSAVGAITAFSGVKNSPTPFDVTPGTILVQASSTAVGATTITTASANAVVVMLGMAGGSSAPTWSGWKTTSPAALTEVVDARTTVTANATVGVAWAVKPTAGATGAGAATLSAAQRHGAILLALSPANTATKLAVTSISPTTPGAGSAFSVTVQAQDAAGSASAVLASTAVTLSKATGAGTLGGTLTGTIPAGASSVTISGVTYSQGDTGVSITATRTSGDTLTAGTSATFAVYGTATKLAFGVGPSTATAGSPITPAITVLVQDANDTTVGNATDAIAMVIGTNPAAGTLSGTTPVAAVAGVATFSDLSINNIGTGYTLTATSGSLTSVTSAAFNILDGNCIANATGAWNVAGTWSCGHVPLATDNVSILGTATATAVVVTIPTAYNAVARTVTIGNTAASAINNASSIAFASATSTLTVGLDVTIRSPGANAVRNLNVGAGAVTVGGSVLMGSGANGTNAGQVAQVTITTGTLTVAGNLALNADNFAGVPAAQNQIVMSGGAGTFNLAGSFTINVSGTMTPGTTSTFNFNGTSAQTIPIGVSSVTYANLRVSNTSASGATLSAAMTTTNVTGNLSVTAGTLDNGGFAIAGPGGKTVTVAAGATLRLGGTSTLPTGYSTYSLDPDSTVEYYGGAQAVASTSPYYGNLVLSGTTGAKTLASTITVYGDFLNNLSGSATLVNTGSTVTFGSNVNLQTIGGTTATTFNNVTVNNSAGGVSLDLTTTVAGTLTLTGGIVDTNISTLVVSSTATSSVSGGSSTSYVLGLLQRGIGLSGSSQTFAFPVGDASVYTPVSVVIPGNSVTVAGTLTASTTAGNHPNLGTSGISATQDVNRYWTLTAGGSLALGAYTPTFTWGASGDTNGTLATGSLLVRKYASSAWTAPSTSSSYTAGPPPSETATSYSGTFGDYAVGNAGAVQLAITSVNGGSSPTAGTSFNVVVTAQGSGGATATVGSNTVVTLAVTTGGGTLGGTISGTILNGTSSVTLPVTYTKAETGVVLTASASGLTSGASAAFTVLAGAAAKLQVLMPGETAAPGTASGKTGTPSDRVAGVAFNVTVNAVDANWNLVSTAVTSVAITSSDTHAVLPASHALVAGTYDFSVTFKTGVTYSTVTATGSPLTTGVSAPAYVNHGTATQLQILLPGETADPGSATGKTGSPSGQTAGANVSVTVNAVDDYFNLVDTQIPEIQLTSSDTNMVTVTGGLVAGTRTYTVVLRTAGSRTVTATDVTTPPPTYRFPTATSAAVTVSAGTATQLQVILPGQSAAPGTVIGKTGTANSVAAGTGYSVTVNAVDAYWNIDTSATPVVVLTTTDANAIRPYSGATPAYSHALVAGTFTFDAISSNGVTFKTAATQTVTATWNSGGSSLAANTSSGITVSPASVYGLQVLLPGEVAAPGTSTGKTAATPTPVTAGASVAVLVNAVDVYWNVVTSANPTITYGSSDANAITQANDTLVNGTMLGHVTFKTAGSQTVIITTTSWMSPNTWSSASVTVGAGTASRLLVLLPGQSGAPGTVSGRSGAPTNNTAGTAVTVTVKSTDAYWNPVTTGTGSGATVQITSSDSNASLPSNNTLSSGVQTFSITFHSVGDWTVTATDVSGSPTLSLDISTSIDIAAGTATKLLVLMPGESSAPNTTYGKSGSPSTRTAGVGFTITVVSVDPDWNPSPVTSTTGLSLSRTSGTGTLGGTLTGSITIGATTAVFNGITYTVAESGVVVTATRTSGMSPLSDGASTSFTVQAGTGQSFTLALSPDTVVANGTDSATATATLRDSGNNLTNCGSTVTITAHSGGPSIGSVSNPSTGIYEATITASYEADTDLITATCGTLTATADFTETPGDPVKLQILLPGETGAPGTSSSGSGKTGSPTPTPTAGSPITIRVNAVDAYWNIVTTQTTTIHLTSTDANAILPADTDLVDGWREFNVTFLTATGTGWTITANDTAYVVSPPAGLAPATSAARTVNAGAATRLQVLLTGQTAAPGSVTGKSGAASDADAGDTVTVTVNATDQYWNLVTSAEPTVSLFLNHYSLTGVVTTTDPTLALVSGTKDFTATLKIAGQWNFTATDEASPGLGTATSSTIDVLNLAASQLQILVPGETAAPGTATGKTGTPDNQTAGQPFAVTINAVDAYWNVDPAATPTINLTYEDPNAVTLNGIALVAGTRSGFVTMFTAKNTPGWTVTVTWASGGSNLGHDHSSAVNVYAGTATKLQLLVEGETAAPGTVSGKTGEPADMSSGSTVDFTVNATDDYWNPVTSVKPQVTLDLSSTHATCVGSCTAYLSSDGTSGETATGTYAFSATFKTAGYPVVTVTDLSSGLAAGASSQLDIDHTEAVKFLVLLPGEAYDPGSDTGKMGTPTPKSADDLLTIVVLAVDPYWNVADQDTSLAAVATPVVQITSSDPKAVLPANGQLADGLLPFQIYLRTAGSQTVTATYVSGDPTGMAGQTATSASITISAGAADHVEFATQPAGAAHGDALATQPVGNVEDAYDNVRTGDSTTAVMLYIAPGTPLTGGNPALLAGTNVIAPDEHVSAWHVHVTAVNGVVNFGGDLKIYGVGTGYQLVIDSPGLTSEYSSQFNITPRPINVTAADATKQFDGTTACSSPTAGSCTPTITSGTLVNGTTAEWTQTFDTALPGYGKVLTPTGAVSDPYNYAVTFVTSEAGVITGTTISVEGAMDLGTAVRGETVASPARTLSWQSYETSAKRVAATMTVPLTSSGGTIASSNLTLWSTDGLTETSLGTLDSMRTVKVIAANTLVQDNVEIFVTLFVPYDAALASYSGTITYSIETP